MKKNRILDEYCKNREILIAMIYAMYLSKMQNTCIIKTWGNKCNM